MKKRSLGMKLLVAGSLMTVAVACQPKTPKAAEAPCPAEMNQIRQNSDDTDEDIDNGAYGNNDQSTSKDKEPVPAVEAAPVISDMKEVLQAAAASVEILVSGNGQEAEVVTLEAVKPIEIEPLHQEEVSDNSAK